MLATGLKTMPNKHFKNKLPQNFESCACKPCETAQAAPWSLWKARSASSVLLLKVWTPTKIVNRETKLKKTKTKCVAKDDGRLKQTKVRSKDDQYTHMYVYHTQVVCGMHTYLCIWI